MSVQQAMEMEQLRQQLLAAHLSNSLLRQAVECAICAVCGDTIGARPWKLSEGGDEPMLIHEECK